MPVPFDPDGVSRRAFLVTAGGGAAALALGRGAVAEEAVAGGVGSRARKRVAALARGFLDRHGAPGLSVAYARRGKLVYVAAFGMAAPDGGDPLTTGHRFRIASVSKPITAAAVMLLVERGKLSRNDRVFGQGGRLDDRFPLPPDAPRVDWLRAVTVDHLLTHTGGGWANDSSDPMFADPRLGRDDLIRETLRSQALVSPPGTQYAYSNFGYCLLGRVIEVVSGEPYETFVRDNLLAPSGAAGMRVAGNRPGPRNGDEVRYAPFMGFDPYRLNVERMDSHGGWIASATDLIGFATHVDGYKSVPDVIASASVKVMRTPATPGYGRGWQLNPRHRNRWHNGLLAGSASILVCVDGDSCFAGLVNSRGRDDDSIAGDLDRLMWDIYGQVFG